MTMSILSLIASSDPDTLLSEILGPYERVYDLDMELLEAGYAPTLDTRENWQFCSDVTTWMDQARGHVDTRVTFEASGIVTEK